MAKTILVQFKGEDNVSKTAKNVENSVKRIGTQSATTAANIDKAWKTSSGSLQSLGSEFRYMSLAVGIASAGVIGLTKGFVNAAKEMEQARLKLGVFAVSAGEDMGKVNAAAEQLYSTGLLSLEDASTSLANLLATGLGLDKATKLLNTFLDSAVVAKESINDTYGTALVKASLGVRIFQERQIDAIGINTQLSKVFQDYGKSIGVASTSLTNAQKYQAIFNFYMKEGQRTTGAAALATETFSGALSRLSAATKITQARIGNALIPIIGTFADLLQRVSVSIGNFAQAFPEMTAVMVTGTVVAITLAAALAGLGAIVPLLTTGFKALTFAATALVTKGLFAVLSKFAVAAAIIGTLTFAVIKATGGWDKWTNAMKNLSTRIAETIKPMNQMEKQMEEMNSKLARQLSDINKGIFNANRDFQEGMAEWVRDHDKSVSKITSQINDLEREYKQATDKIRQSFSDTMTDLDVDHARKTEDIQQQLDEEVSKGIWADQTRIRELQKALKRENEDYARAQTKNEERRDDDLTDQTDKYNDRLAELKKELEEEQALEKKHAEIIAKYRTFPLLDEIEMRQRALKERLDQYALEKSRALEDASAQIESIQSIGDEYGNLLPAIGGVGMAQDQLASDSKSMFGELLTSVASVAAGWIGFRTAVTLAKTAWATGVAEAVAVSATGAGQIAATWAGVRAAMTIATPWTALAAAGVGAYVVIQRALDEYHKDFNSTLNSFDTWRIAIDGRREQLIQMYRSGKISQDEFRRGIQEVMTQQQQLSSQFSQFYSGQFPSWLNWILDRFQTLQNAARNLISAVSPPAGTPVYSGISNSTPSYYIPPNQTSTSATYPSLSSYLAPAQGPIYSPPRYQEGGVIPGSPSTPVPIIAHGGETVLPHGVEPITININNPTVRSEEDIRQLAFMVKQVLTSDTKYRHLR